MIQTKGVIYAIINKSTRQRYVGSSIDPETRIRAHFYALARGDHDNIHLQRAYNKLGPDAFEPVVLEECDPTMIVEREQFHIDQTPRERSYNLCENAYRPPSRRGCTLTNEHRRKIGQALRGRRQSDQERLAKSLALKGRIFSAQHCQAISRARRGTKASPEARQNMSESHRGFTHTAESKAKIGAANRGHKHTAEAIAKMAQARRLYYAQRRAA